MMHPSTIATASLLDIIFDGRFKDYGAYPLRKNYNGRLALSLGIVLLATSIIFGFSAGLKPKLDLTPIPVSDDTLRITEAILPKPVDPPRAEVPQVMIRQEQYTAPLITAEPIDQEDLMAPVDDLQTAIIGTSSLMGVDGDFVNAPAAENRGTGLAIEPVTSVSQPDTFIRVEVPAEYPGDWRRFLEQNLRYPQTAIENGIQGTVRVQFVVNEQGEISNITALNDPGYGLAGEATRIIKKSLKWRPAEQNGRKVIYRHTQSITFVLQ